MHAYTIPWLHSPSVGPRKLLSGNRQELQLAGEELFREMFAEMRSKPAGPQPLFLGDLVDIPATQLVEEWGKLNMDDAARPRLRPVAVPNALTLPSASTMELAVPIAPNIVPQLPAITAEAMQASIAAVQAEAVQVANVATIHTECNTFAMGGGNYISAAAVRSIQVKHSEEKTVSREFAG